MSEFEDEMRELCDGVKPTKAKATASAANMVRGEKNGGLPFEADGSKPLLNTKHESFAHLMAAGSISQTQAYLQVYQCSQQTAEDASYRLMTKQDNFGVVRRFTYLREQMSSRAVLTVRERREFLANVVRTPVGAINENSPLAQEVVYEENEKGSRTKVKMPGKLEALKLDAEMAGELTPGGHEKTPMRLRLIAHSSGDAHSIAAEIDGI